ncbi:MAG: putative lipid II flippase FtsW [Oceanospirillaceae bacterium]|nr:putative lipid II flippase FtsW [Oceanospirillaceae bacterium]
MGIGWLMVTTASTGVAEYNTGNSLYYSIRHGVYLVLGIVIALGVSQVSIARWQAMELPLFAAAMVSLVLVLMPVIGHEVNGSRRWLNLGIIKIQASEVAKLAAVMFVSGYLLRRQEEVRRRFWGFLKPLILLSAMVVLLLKEPDFGAVVVLMGAALIQLFLGGVRVSQYVFLIVIVAAAGYYAVVSADYRMDRITGFLDPFAPEFVYNGGYQLTQSLIAFGRGDLLGVGLGESVQKLFYLPEAHTDFVFAIWAEETGLIGALFAVGALGYLLALIWRTAWRAQIAGHMYGAYLAAGIASLLTLQVLINLGVNTGLLPTKGLTLPFFSYGGSSLLVACCMVGIVMRISHEVTVGTQEDVRGATDV